MLFQYALQVALGGGRVVFISSSDATQQRRPLLPASLDEDEAGEAFGRIGLRYISTKHELQMFFASLASPTRRAYHGLPHVAGHTHEAPS